MKRFAVTCMMLAAVVTGCKHAGNSLSPLAKDRPRIVQTGPKTLQTEFDFCLHKPLTRADHLKMIFVLDKSGSNAGTAQVPGSDAFGERRYQTLLNYLNTVDSDAQENTSYALIQFSTDTRVASNFTNNLEAFKATVRHEANPANAVPPNPQDYGWTDYLGALRKVKDLVDADIKASAGAVPIVIAHYVIFFISDGVPLLNGAAQDPAQILNLVRDIRNFEISAASLVGSVVVHTGYYFNNANQDPAAQLIMSQVAAAGNGDALSFGEGQIIDFDSFRIPEQSIEYGLKDFYVDYVNGVWSGGKFLHDKDADGLSDESEAKFGSNPAKTDSDGNGVSDLVETTIYGKPCKDARCLAASAIQFPNCSAFRPPGTPAGTYGDTDFDGLNDCEERQLNSNHVDADSNGAWLPDLFALKRGYGLNAGKSGLTIDPDQDSVSNYIELKTNTPLHFPNDLVDVKPYEYRMTLESSAGASNCFHLDVKNIPVLETGDRLRAYLFESTSVLDAKKYLRVGEKAIGADLKLKFKNEDLK